MGTHAHMSHTEMHGRRGRRKRREVEAEEKQEERRKGRAVHSLSSRAKTLFAFLFSHGAGHEAQW